MRLLCDRHRRRHTKALNLWISGSDRDPDLINEKKKNKSVKSTSSEGLLLGSPFDMSTADTQALMGVQHRADGHPALQG